MVDSTKILVLLSIFCACMSSLNGISHRSTHLSHAGDLPNANVDIQVLTTNSTQLEASYLSSDLLSLRGGFVFSSLIEKLEEFVEGVFGSFLPKSWFGRKKGKKSRYGKKRSNKKSSSNSRHVSGDTNNRIQKEIKAFLENPPDNCELKIGKNIRSWVVIITGAEGTIFAGEKYKLKMNFPKDYPAKPPSVYFLKPCPKHMHVYTNGDICLNFLGRDWRPTLTAEALAVSILSMLSSAKEKTIPQDNALHADAPPGLQQDNWMYHDDRC